VLYLMLSGTLPFMGANDRQVCAAVLRGPIDTNGPAWDGVSDGAKSVVMRMLCRDPASRATPEELLAHPWLAREAVVVAVAAAQAPTPLAPPALAKAKSAPAASIPTAAAAAAAVATAAPAAAVAAAAAAAGPRGASRSLCGVPSALPPRPRASELRSISASAAGDGAAGCGGRACGGAPARACRRHGPGAEPRGPSQLCRMHSARDAGAEPGPREQQQHQERAPAAAAATAAAAPL
jgi:hypothetical protein